MAITETEIRKGDLVIITTLIQNDAYSVLKFVAPGAIFKATSGIDREDNSFQIELRDKSYLNIVQHFKLYDTEAKLLCRAVAEVKDVGIKYVCSTCPKQLACLAYQATRN